MNDNIFEEKNFFIVGLGASAGGIQALELFFSNLPDNPNAAFVVVQHLSQNIRSAMVEILQKHSSMAVISIEDNMVVQANQIYLLPPGNFLELENDRLHLERKAATISADYSIDRFFQSLARNWGQRTVGILLSGTGNDGTQGIEAISRAGGIALVQSPETAQFTSMPTSAIPSGLVDEILSPQDLAQTVYELIHFSDSLPNIKSEEANLIDPQKLQRILDLLSQKENIDFTHYKVSTLSRRINHRCALSRQGNLDNYINYLENTPKEQKQLRQDLLIGATRFFRDPPAWEIIEREILPQLVAQLEQDQQLRIWVSACATGEEAYTVAILVHEAFQKANKPLKTKIFATDIDNNALEVAAQGFYPETIANDISGERLEEYFTYEGGQFRVKRFLREMLIIAPQDLTRNAGFSRMHLVTCRNVLIYMQPQLQQQVLRLLHFAVDTNGYLFLGSSETLGNLENEFITLDSKWKIFRKRRETHLSLMPINRQTVFTPVYSPTRIKTRQNYNDRLLGQVFQQCLGERQITCFLVNTDNQLVRVFYNSAQLLDFPLGEVLLDVTEIVYPSLRLPLSTALHRSKRDKQPVLYTGIKLNRNKQEEIVNLKVNCQPESSNLQNYLIVVLEVETSSLPSSPVLRFEVNEEAAQQITELEYELQQTRENLQIAIEELETTNEEQQATNEELLASNEELQSTNEELQSVNEELYTVNSEYQAKIQELTELNNDIDNLLRSTEIGVVFLDRDLNIRKFTPASSRAINIKFSDIGRPISDLTTKLNLPNLVEILQQVTETNQSLIQEVYIAETDDHLLMRVNPYFKKTEEIEGIVIIFVEINEIKEIQLQLQETNEILENLYSSSPIGLGLFNYEYRFIRINQALADMNGYPPEYHLGKTMEEVNPDLGATIQPLLEQVTSTRMPINNREISVTTPNEERYWLASYYPVDFLVDGCGVGVFVVEITEQTKIETELRLSRAKLIEAQKLAKVGNWQLNLEQTTVPVTAIPEWSEELFRIYGFDPQQPALSFQQMLPYYATEDQEKLQQAFEGLYRDGRAFSLDVCFYNQNQEMRYLNTIGQTIRNQEGQITMLYGTVMDITERKQNEEILRQQNQALEEAIAVAQAADSANQAKSEFLANISHELRTPLNAILMATQILQRTILDQRQQQSVRFLKSNTEKLINIINDILDLSKLEARKLDLQSQEFILNELIQGVINTFTYQLSEKGLTILTNIEQDLPSILIGDELRLQQILSNLVSNAIKFTDSGQITILVSPEPTQEDDNILNLRFRVQDTGIGIAANDIERLFQPFTQLDNSLTRTHGGTGLGLSICRRIVELMGGKIGVESRLGEGSTFWFTVPLTLPKSAIANSSELEEVEASASLLQGLTVLVVEDNQANRRLFVIMLQSLGCQTDFAENGQQALDKLAEQAYDFVLLDCQMPVLDGYETARLLRQREGEERHTIIIGITGHAMEGSREQCLEAGMDDYVSKPVLLDNLIEVLTRWRDSV